MERLFAVNTILTHAKASPVLLKTNMYLCFTVTAI
jgi:hypothetical protein